MGHRQLRAAAAQPERRLCSVRHPDPRREGTKRSATPIGRKSSEIVASRSGAASIAPIAENSSRINHAALYDNGSDAETVVMSHPTGLAAHADSSGSLCSTVAALHRHLHMAPDELASAQRRQPTSHQHVGAVGESVIASSRRHSSSCADADMVPATSEAVAMELDCNEPVAAGAAATNDSRRSERPKRKSAQQADFHLQTASCKDTRKKRKQTKYYKVARIIDSRFRLGCFEREYLVEWKDYDVTESTWEPRSVVRHTDAFDGWQKGQAAERHQARIRAAREYDDNCDPFTFTG